MILPGGVADDVLVSMTLEHDLDQGWLNDSAKAFIPAVGLEDWIEVIRDGHVSISIASPELLLAMKLHANRRSRDWDDIHFLLEHLGIESVERAQEIYERYHAHEVIPDSAVQRLQAWLEPRPR